MHPQNPLEPFLPLQLAPQIRSIVIARCEAGVFCNELLWLPIGHTRPDRKGNLFKMASARLAPVGGPLATA